MEEWLKTLYPLGYLSCLIFGSRSLLQWLSSEIQEKSVVNKLFWKLSLCGNLIAFTHSFIQIQYPIALIQAINGFVSWRNLNLMQSQDKQLSFKKACFTLGMIVILTLGALYVHYNLLPDHMRFYFRVPVSPWNQESDGAMIALWHLLGGVGLILFNGRFWIQWYSVEKSKTSYLSPLFWWSSLIGDSLCLIYFSKLYDPVNLLGHTLGLVPYIRNLMLIYKSKLIKTSVNAHD